MSPVERASFGDPVGFDFLLEGLIPYSQWKVDRKSRTVLISYMCYDFFSSLFTVWPDETFKAVYDLF